MLSTAGEASPAASGQASWVRSAGSACLQCPEGATCHLHLFLPPSHAVHVSGLRMWGKRNELLWQPPAWTGKPRVTHKLSLSLREIAGWDLSWPWSGSPWEWGGACQVKLHLLLSQCIQTQFWAPEAGWNFSSGSLDFSKALWSVGDCFRQCFPGATGPRLVGGGMGSSSQFTGYFRVQSGPKSVSLLVDLWGSKTPLRSPWHRVLDAAAPRRYFCSWFNAKLLLLRAKQRGQTPYSATRLMSLLKGLSF